MTFKWITKEGKKLGLKEIGDNHLLNIQKMLLRQKTMGIVRGDICGCEGSDIDVWLDDEWTEEDQKTYKKICKEIKKRGLNDSR